MSGQTSTQVELRASGRRNSGPRVGEYRGHGHQNLLAQSEGGASERSPRSAKTDGKARDRHIATERAERRTSAPCRKHASKEPARQRIPVSYIPRLRRILSHSSGFETHPAGRGRADKSLADTGRRDLDRRLGLCRVRKVRQNTRPRNLAEASPVRLLEDDPEILTSHALIGVHEG